MLNDVVNNLLLLASRTKVRWSRLTPELWLMKMGLTDTIKKKCVFCFEAVTKYILQGLGEFVSSKTVTSGNRTVETITYKTEKDGIIETHVEHRVTIHSDAAIDYDAVSGQLYFH